MKASKWLINNLPWLILTFVGLLLIVFFTFGNRAEDGSITLDGKPAQISDATKDFIEEAKEAMSKIVYAEKAVPTLLADGTTIDAPTIESIDGPITKEEHTEGGRGAYVYAPTSSFEEFKNYTIGKCWDVDGYYGAQCWDLGALFWMNYTKDGRWLDTCGTGAAKGAWDCKEKNAGDEFALVYNAGEIKTGDWIIFGSGEWGHVCEAAGPYNGGWVACYGENQGGSACPNGGAAANIVNLSLASFRGAFRPKTYVQPEPTPTPTPVPEPVASCDRIEVMEGDTLGAIMERCEGKIEWGEAMNAYARSWKSTKVKFYPTVYDGWVSPNGVGLFAGDIIERAK